MKKQRGDPLYLRKIAIVDRLVKPGYNKAMELKMIKQLLKTYNLEFLETVRLNFQLFSLIWFIGKGKKELNKQYKIYSMRKKEDEPKDIVPLEKEKIGEDREVKREETLVTFLNEKRKE